MGKAGRPDGGARTARLAAGAPLSHHGDHSRGRSAEDRDADGRRPRRPYLYAPGPEGHAGRHLRDEPATLVHGRRAVGLRRRTPSGEHRPNCGRTRTRPPPLSGPSNRRDPQMGQRRLHLLARWQSACRPDRWKTRLLACLRRHGRLPSGRRRRQDAGGMDGSWRAGRRRFRPRHRPLWTPRVQSRIHPADHRRILCPPVRDDLSQRAIARRPTAEDNAGLRRDDGGGRQVGQLVGSRNPALLRLSRFQRKADSEALQRLRHRRGRMPRRARGRGAARYRAFLTL